jgi:hypothetical protein
VPEVTELRGTLDRVAASRFPHVEHLAGDGQPTPAKSGRSAVRPALEPHQESFGEIEAGPRFEDVGQHVSGRSPGFHDHVERGFGEGAQVAPEKRLEHRAGLGLALNEPAQDGEGASGSAVPEDRFDGSLPLPGLPLG